MEPRKKPSDILIKIFTIAAAVLIGIGGAAGILIGTSPRDVAVSALPEITPEPVPTPQPTPEIMELSDEEGAEQQVVLDETGELLMRFAFAKYEQMENDGAETEGVLFPGVHDEKVIDLKLKLIDLEYMEGDEPTDYYGEQLAYAVQLFQRNMGFEETGITDEETMVALSAEDAPMYVVSLGMTGTDVSEIQKQLSELGYLKLSTTGYFGTDTRNAVKAFQKNNGLSADGVVGSVTRELLYSGEVLKAGETPEPDPTPKKTAAATQKPESTKQPEKTKAPEATKDAAGEAKPEETKTPETAEPEKTKEPEKEESSSKLPAPDTAKVEQFIDYAQGLLGKKYVLGGKGPDVFDCSGFIYYALNHSGVKDIKYMTSYGWAGSSFPTVSKSELKRGDILCFNGHVGIYLGNDSMLDASSEQGKIRITNNIWSKNYWVKNWKYGKRALY